MITVVIPTLNQNNYTDQLLFFISNNLVLPKEIILIDDGGNTEYKDLLKKYENLKIKFIKHDKTLGVNYSWNEGISLSKTPIISVINNDLVISNYFFKKIIESYNKENWGIVCPKTISRSKNVKLTNDDEVILEKMGKREGWCWTVRSEFIKNIDPIPSFLRTYCGDDYIFLMSKIKKYPIFKMMNNYIFHYGSGTVSVTKECNGERIREKKLWNNFKKDKLGDKII